MTYAIDTRALTKRYGARTAVDGLDLQVKAGEFFALLGPNGAGKTTLIRMLSCLTPPTQGDAFLMGDSIVSAPRSVKQRLNISPQETAVAPQLSVRENLELIARLYGCPKDEARLRAERSIQAFGMGEYARSKAKTLSGGMQRRLSLAMALITEPEIIFLDEPTLGLDVRARRDLWRHLEALKGQTTVILTTHYLEEAEALSDRIGIIHEGRIRALGTVDELKADTGLDNFEDVFITLTEGEV